MARVPKASEDAAVAIAERLRSELGKMPPRKNRDGSPNPEHFKELLSRVNLIQLRAAEEGVAVPGMDSIAKSIIRQIELEGLNPKELEDHRTPAERAEALVERMEQDLSLGEAIDAELEALEQAMDLVDQRSLEWLAIQRERLAEQRRSEGAEDAKTRAEYDAAERRAEAGKRWRERLRRLRKIRKRAREAFPGLPDGRPKYSFDARLYEHGVRAMHPLRYAIYVMRSDNASLRAQGPTASILRFGMHHVEMAWGLYLAQNDLYLYNDDVVPWAHEYDGAMLISPPGHGKTTIAHAQVALWINQNPAEQIIWLHSITAEAAKNVGYVCRMFSMRESVGRRNFALFGHRAAGRRDISPLTGLRLQGREATKQPTLVAAGLEQAGSGANASKIVMDDIIDPQSVHLDSYVAQVEGQINGVWLRRIRGRGFHLTTATLWHEKDPNVKRMRQAQKGEVNVLTVVQKCGGPDDRPAFKPLWPEMYPEAFLRKRYAEMGNPRLYSAQYRAMPISDDGRIIRELRYYDPTSPEHEAFLASAVFHLSLDPTARDKAGSDKAGIIYAAAGEVECTVRLEDGTEERRREGRLRIIDAREMRTTQMDLAKWVAEFSRGQNVDYVHVEAVAGFYGLVEYLQETFGMTVFSHQPGMRDKGVRLRQSAPFIENGLAGSGGFGAVVEFPAEPNPKGELKWLPKEMMWLRDSILDFGVAKGNHGVDALTQLVNHLASTGDLRRGRGIVSETVSQVMRGERATQLREWFDRMGIGKPDAPKFDDADRETDLFNGRSFNGL